MNSLCGDRGLFNTRIGNEPGQRVIRRAPSTTGHRNAPAHEQHIHVHIIARPKTRSTIRHDVHIHVLRPLQPPIPPRRRSKSASLPLTHIPLPHTHTLHFTMTRCSSSSDNKKGKKTDTHHVTSCQQTCRQLEPGVVCAFQIPYRV